MCWPNDESLRGTTPKNAKPLAFKQAYTPNTTKVPMIIKIEKTPIEGLLRVTPPRFGDDRGFFSETFNTHQMTEQGIGDKFVQDNHSFSVAANTIRGLHFQAPPHAQAKLVRCGRGRIFDVGVDIRRGSPTYGRWFGTELSFQNGLQLLIPIGFLHGFMTLEQDCEIIYKCSDYYAPECEGAVIWDDPDIGIRWPDVEGDATLSQKDQTAASFRGFTSPFNYESADA